jgi:hypothetical protein
METQGTPAPAPRARTPWAVAAGIFVGGLLVGMVLASLHVAGAQTPSATPDAGPFKGHGFRHGFGGGIHGQFTVPAPGGGYETILTQRGTVTDVSASSITVKSEDGFTHTYSVDNNTLVAAGNNGIADVSKGDTVRVLAVGNAAKEIVDRTKVQSLRQKYWVPRHRYNDTTPEPSGSASPTSDNA